MSSQENRPSLLATIRRLAIEGKGQIKTSLKFLVAVAGLFLLFWFGTDSPELQAAKDCAMATYRISEHDLRAISAEMRKKDFEVRDRTCKP